MSFLSRNDVLLFASGIALLVVAFRVPSRLPSKPTEVTSAVAGLGATTPAVASAPGPVRVVKSFVFDCAAFEPAAPPSCPAPPPAEQALLDAANSYRAGMTAVWSKDMADSADAALKGASALDPQELPPLERAALQNAALLLLSKSARIEHDPRASEAATAARALVKKLALTRTEIAALPAAAGVAADWLGAADGWQRGAAPRFFHMASDAFTRAHRQMMHEDTLADLVRMVLVSDDGTPVVSDVAQRLVLRRTEADAVHVCIAEVDPLSESCGKPGALRALEAARGRMAVAPTSSAPCMGCHVNNTPKSASFGPATGFDLGDPSVAPRIQGMLKSVLHPDLHPQKPDTAHP